MITTDSKKLPIEEEKERYEDFLKELNSIGREYTKQNEERLMELRDAISKFLDRFVGEKQKQEFISKTKLLFVISGYETESEKYEREMNDYLDRFDLLKMYLTSSIKTMEYALKTDYLREKSDADRRGIVFDRKTKGSGIEIVDGLREEVKRLKKRLAEAESKEHQTEVKNGDTKIKT